jgi:hypothetical protein
MKRTEKIKNLKNTIKAELDMLFKTDRLQDRLFNNDLLNLQDKQSISVGQYQYLMSRIQEYKEISTF